jgi:hypothetical protein
MDLELNAGSDAAQEEAVLNTDVQPQEGENEAKDKTGNPKVDDPWPKTARNAISRRDKQIGAMRAQNAEFQRRLEAFEAAQNKGQEPKEPKDTDYDNYGDYLKALAKFKPQEDARVDPKQIHEQAKTQAMQEFYYNSRVEAVAQQAQKAVQDVPELSHMLEEYSDVLDTYPQHVEMAFLEAENAPLAFYALAKEGKLESLAHMNAVQAAMTVAQAQLRGEQMVKASKVSKAPAPIQGARGSSASTKDALSMAPDELLKSIRGG